MSIENTQDGKAMPPASAGSVANAGTLRDTFAAAALTGLLSSLPNGDQYHSFAVEKAWSLADAMLRERVRKNTPTTTLTDAEREAVEYFSEWCMGPSERLKRYKDTLRGLLERLGGGE